MKSPVLAVVIWLSLAPVAHAQTLTRAEEGRKEVGRSLIADLQASGLWVTNDRDYPRPGTDAFNAACENAYDSSAVSGRADSRLEVARELLQRGQKPLE